MFQLGSVQYKVLSAMTWKNFRSTDSISVSWNTPNVGRPRPPSSWAASPRTWSRTRRGWSRASKWRRRRKTWWRLRRATFSTKAAATAKKRKSKSCRRRRQFSCRRRSALLRRRRGGDGAGEIKYFSEENDSEKKYCKLFFFVSFTSDVFQTFCAI